MMPLVRVSEVQRGLDAQICRVTVFDGHSHFLRAITSLAVLVPAEKENVNEPIETSRKRRIATEFGEREKHAEYDKSRVRQY
jgi:hypothetical protein